MKTQILVDTDILIDVARRNDDAIQRLIIEEENTNIAISVVTKMELIVGCRNKNELRNLEKFLLRYSIININDAISNQAVKLLHDYRLSHGLLIPDALIASTAIIFNIPLLSKNQSDYRFISQLSLLPYP